MKKIEKNGIGQKSSIPLRFAFYVKQGFLWFIGRHHRPRKPVPDIVRAFLVLVSSFGSMISINLVLEYGDAFKHRNSPLLPQWVRIGLKFFDSRLD